MDCRRSSSTRLAPRSGTSEQSVNHDAADALARMHQVERPVDVGERHHMSDHRINLDVAVQVPVDDLRPVGAASGAAEGGTLPDAGGDEPKRPGLDLGAG